MSVLDALSVVERQTTANHPQALSSTPLLLDARRLAHPDAAPISPLLYSGFIEHMGRCIYGGIVDNPDAPSPKELLSPQGQKLGWRKDVMELLGSQGDLQCPMIRWPGGNYVSNYHWQDGIGAERKTRRELAWESLESNRFGTDEYIDWCRATKVEPYICLNMGTGTLEEALDWLEYCNGTQSTYWANQRRKNTGRDEPHGVKVWGLGNEMWGDWQVGHLTAIEYAKKARSWAHALRMVDPTIKLVLCGREGSNEWDFEILKHCIDMVDWHSIHGYTVINYRDNPDVTGMEYEVNVFGPASAERNIQTCKALIDVVNNERLSAGKTTHNVKICFDEWNVWDPVIAHPTQGNEQHYDYTDMLGFCAWLNVLVRESKDCPIACLAQSVNSISPILTRPDGVLLQATYYPLRLFSRLMKGGHLLDLAPCPDRYDGPAHPRMIQHLALRPAYIDVCAIIVGSSIRISILNRHPSADWKGSLEIGSFDVEKVQIHEIYSDDLAAKNTWEKPDLIKPTVTELSKDEWKAGQWTVRKHSWMLVVLDGK